jgi:hypothetical protein
MSNRRRNRPRQDIQVAPKNVFVDVWAKLTSEPVPEVRARVRALYINGLGPYRAEALLDETLGQYILAFIGTSQHKSAFETVERLSAFRLVAAPRDVDMLPPDLLRPIKRGRLKAVMAAIIRSINDDYHPARIDYIECAWPPVDKILIRIATAGLQAPMKLTFASDVAALKTIRAGSPTTWPVQTSKKLDGEVLRGLQGISTSKDPRHAATPR